MFYSEIEQSNFIDKNSFTNLEAENFPFFSILIVTREELLVTNILQMFERRMDDLDRLLVQSGMSPEDLEHPGQCKSLSLYFKITLRTEGILFRFCCQGIISNNF